MKQPLFVRPLSNEEREALKAECCSHDALTLRRCQIVLASAAGQRASQISGYLHCSRQTVRNAIHAFSERGVACLERRSSRPQKIPAIFDEVKLEQLKALLHNNHRNLGKKRSTWTLGLLAQACTEQRITEQEVSVETLRRAFGRLGVSWQRAKNWISSPDRQYQLKKLQRERFIKLAQAHQDWVLVFLDEVWWSRLASASA
ncbi:MAG: helix-turn-helix domain-containing protein [Chroococcidiopsidaceae cyanobacterium CP_BM_RX_35]|nr:helix-turn-helix domain-containing protein [Chroococcidiopsidaceae cyanobacterium CP_BM_RX_35]